MRYRVKAGAVVNHNSKLYLEGEILEDLAPRVAADSSVAGSIELVEEEKAAPAAQKVKGE